MKLNPGNHTIGESHLDAYSAPAGDGAISVDMEAIAVDLVTAAKVAQMPRDEFLKAVAKTYDSVTVKVERLKLN